MTDQPQRVALITPATGPVGKAVAAELARRGWSLCLQHPHGQDGQAAVAEALREAAEAGRTIEAEALAADLSDAPQREQLVEGLLDRFERIDLLVNAPFRPESPADLLEITEADFRAAMDSCVTASLFLTQLVAAEMVRLAEGGLVENPKIVTVNSLSAYVSRVDHAAQCISRAGLSMLSRLFADRLGEHGITVYEIRTGILSAGAGDLDPDRYERLIEQGLTPLRRWGRAGDVACAVAAVAEDLLAFSTGEVINVDGGFHLRRL